MAMICKEIISHILKLCSNVSFIPYYSYCEVLEPKTGYENDNGTAMRANFFVKGNDTFREIEKKDFEFSFGDDVQVNLKPNIEIFYKKNISPLGCLYYLVRMDNNLNFSLYVNRTYYLLFRWKVENVLPPGQILKDLTYIRLLLGGYLTIHSSSFAKNEEEGYLVIAPSDTGKSLTALRAVNDGYFFLSEDLTLLGKNGMLWSIPYTSTLKHEKRKMKYKPILLIASLFYYYKKPKPAFNQLNAKLLDKSKTKKLFILERSKYNNVLIVDKKDDEALLAIKDKIFLLNKEEFNYIQNKGVVSYLYSSNIHKKLQKLENNLVKDLINKVEEVVIVKSKTALGFYEQIKKLIKHEI